MSMQDNGMEALNQIDKCLLTMK